MQGKFEQSPTRSDRRAFMKRAGLAAGSAAVGLELLATTSSASADGGLTRGDVAILTFLAVVETIETDLWLQYAELGGVQDSEIPGLPTGGNAAYTAALNALDADMAQYIHDNTDDEFSHRDFLNAYLGSKGAEPVNLDQFRILPSSRATGANQIGRLTNLMQLTVDTSWYTRYRSSAHNPDLNPGFKFPQAVPSLNSGQFPAIPITDADLNPKDHIQASPTLLHSIFASSSKVAAAFIQFWPCRSAVVKCCGSCSALGRPRHPTSRPGMTKQAMPSRTLSRL